MANGRIIGPDNISTGGFSGVASGIWSLTEQLAAIKAGNWPLTGVPFEIKSYGYEELSSSSSSITVQRPTPTEIGDLLIVVVYTTDSRTITAASGWTVVDEDFGVTNNNVYKALYTLTVADATTSWQFNFSATTLPGYVIVNVGPYGEIDNGGTSFARAGYGTLGTQTVPSVDFFNTTNLDLIIAGGRGFISSAPAGFTTLVNTTDGRPDTYFGYRENVTPTSTGTTSLVISNNGSNGLYRIIVGDTRAKVIVNTVTSVTSTIQIPSTGVQEGDIFVLYDHAIGSITIPTAVVPAGFTSIAGGENVMAFTSILISYKVLTSSDIGTTVTGMDGNGADAKIGIVIRGSLSAPVFSNAVVNASATAPISETIPVSTPTKLICLIGYSSSSGAENIATSPTSTANIQLTNGTRYWRLDYSINPETAVSKTISTDYGYQSISGFSVLL